MIEEDPLFSTLLMNVYACMRLVDVLPETDLIKELENILTQQSNIIIDCVEKKEIFIKDLEKMWNKSISVIAQVKKLEKENRQTTT